MTAGDVAPKLAVVFDPRGTRAFRMVEESAGICDMLWLVDTARYDLESHARMLARLGTVVDVANLEPAEIAALLEPHRPAGIVAFVDSELVRTSLIAHAMGLPFHTPEVALRLTNKVAQREAFMAAGIPVPRFWAVPAHADSSAKQQVAGIARFPVVVKPQAGAGGRETYRATDAADLLHWLENPAATTDAELADVIVEELLPDGWDPETRPYADYISVESLVENGRITHLTETGRMPLAEPFRESGFFIPSNLPDDVLADVRALAGRAIDALGAATNGIFHTEIKLTPDGPRVIEVNGRLGGRTADLLALCSHVQLLQTIARLALGLPTDVNEPVQTVGVAYLSWLQPPMRATSIVGLDGVQVFGAGEGIAELVVNKQPGDAFSWRDGDHGYVVSVLGSASDHDAMFAVRQRMTELIDVVYGFAADTDD